MTLQYIWNNDRYLKCQTHFKRLFKWALGSIVSLLPGQMKMTYICFRTLKLVYQSIWFGLAYPHYEGDHISPESGFVIIVVPCMAKVLAYQPWLRTNSLSIINEKNRDRSSKEWRIITAKLSWIHRKTNPMTDRMHGNQTCIAWHMLTYGKQIPMSYYILLFCSRKTFAIQITELSCEAL